MTFLFQDEENRRKRVREKEKVKEAISYLIHHINVVDNFVMWPPLTIVSRE